MFFIGECVNYPFLFIYEAYTDSRQNILKMDTVVVEHKMTVQILFCKVNKAILKSEKELA